MWNNLFEGWYFKHQKDGQTLAFIPGRANGGAFIQIISNRRSYHVDFPALRTDKESIEVGNCVFGLDGVQLDLPDIHGQITYGPTTPLCSDIMGPFRLLPMQCRHGVLSMRHTLKGTVWVEGEEIRFDGGLGYIEKDSGRSFPQEYIWLQCNDFAQSCSVMVSVAHIPFAGFHFTGCICAIVYGGREYRLATYQGVKILRADSEQMILTQQAYRLQIELYKTDTGHSLKSPVRGNMSKMIRECNHAHARLCFSKNGEPLFDFVSENVSFEHVP